jgi:RsiW-degrading membrane proteinase PrsW (M82 family)
MDLILGIFLSLAAAVVPTVLYATAFYLADRYEREPVWMIVVAFLWGAVPAVIASLILQILIGAPMVNAPGSFAESIVEASIVAPIVEEIFKGLAVYIIYRFFRHEFDGVLDGLTYGAIIGFGFAMTENFLYFIGAFNSGGIVDLTVLVILRAVIFGLNHAFYTGLFGMGLGMARHAKSRAAGRRWAMLGLFAAILTHAIHNFGASLSAINSLGIFISLGQAALGAGFIGLAVLLTWQQERRWIKEELAQEVGVTLSRDEYESLIKGWRRSPLLKDRSNPQRVKRLELLVKLAFQRHRLHKLGSHSEPSLPANIAANRQEILALAAQQKG